MKVLTSLFSLTLSAMTLAQPPATQPVTSPVLRMDDVVDTYHGTPVADPFRWLEDTESPDTRAFIDAQNLRTRAWLDTPLRQQLRDRLQQLINFPRMGMPTRQGPFLVYARNTGLQQQSPVFMREGIEGTETVLLDPNTFSADGTVALNETAFTEDGSLVAYGVSEGGSDNQTVRIRDVRTGQDLPDVLTDMRFSSIGWLPDNSGFFFNKFPEPGTVPPEQERLNPRIYLHKLGEDPAHARLLFAFPEDPQLACYPAVSRDGKWLFVYLVRGTDPKGGLMIAALEGSADEVFELRELLAPGRFALTPFEVVGNTLYAVTDHHAPRRKVVAIDLTSPTSSDPATWTILIPQGDDLIDGVTMVNDQLVVNFKRDAATLLSVHDLTGRHLRDIELPTTGTASVSGRREDSTMFIRFTSFTYPSTTYVYDFATNTLTPFFEPTVEFTPDDYETKRVFYTSKDGTRVPMFITHRKDLVMDGTNPTKLYGYGGFGVGMSPFFDPLAIASLEKGAVLAVACIRGGDEYGTTWHDAGRLLNKQNTFDDFHAAAQYLIDARYTSPGNLAIVGGSNGGLLVAASVLQRPELYGAVICQVGVLDMLRYHRFGTGVFWTAEYGNAGASEEQFRKLLSYSPLHNVRPGMSLPPILVTTGDGDDRVVPAHSLKWTAELLRTASPDNLVLLRYDVRAGHGAGKPMSKILDEEADVQAFFWRTVGRPDRHPPHGSRSRSSNPG